MTEYSDQCSPTLAFTKRARKLWFYVLAAMLALPGFYTGGYLWVYFGKDVAGPFYGEVVGFATAYALSLYLLSRLIGATACEATLMAIFGPGAIYIIEWRHRAHAARPKE